MLVSIVAAVGVVLGGGAPAGAEDVVGLEAVVRGADAQAPVVVLTNRGGQACQVVPEALGTIVLLKVEQDGKMVEPVPIMPSFDEDLGYQLSQEFRTLEPGASVELPLPSAPASPAGHSLMTVSWSPQLTVGSWYAIDPGKPLELRIRYASPVTPAAGPPLCAPVEAVGGVGGAAVAGGVPGLLWIIGGVGIVVLATGFLVAVLLRRRRTGAAAVAIVLALGLIGVAWTPSPAAATIIVGPGIDGPLGDCLAAIRAPGGDPRNIMPTLDDPSVRVNVTLSRRNGENRSDRFNIFVYWNPEDRSPFSDGVPRDPCDELYHELYHGFEDTTDAGVDLHECITAGETHTGIAIKEINATRAENDRRRAAGRPERTEYGSLPLPAGDCRPSRPGDPVCHPQRGCPPSGTGRPADSNGDPHISTFDGRRFSFQAVGEFWAVRDTSARDAASALEIQVRQEPVEGSRSVSVNTAVVANVAGDRVEVSVDGGGLRLLVNGVSQPLASGPLPAGGELVYTPKGAGRNAVITIGWADTSYAMVSGIGFGGLHLSVWAAPARAGKLWGLFGDHNGERSDDVRIGSGAPIAEATHDALYPAYADSLRVQAASLFTYPPGVSTETYADHTYPDRPQAGKDDHRLAWAQTLCRRYGLTDAESLNACAVDLANTGSAAFAVAAMTTQSTITAPTSAEPTTTVRIADPGGTSTVEVNATAGQMLYVDVVSSTVRDGCGVLTLRDPAGRSLAGGCVRSGKGNIDAVTLPVTGRYTIVVDPPGNSTGEVRLRLVFPTEQRLAITPDGDQVTSVIADAGATSRLSFSATAGQKVYVDIASATLPDQCGLLSLRGPNGRSIGSGCVTQGKGMIDAVTLPDDGTYSIVVDPLADRTGRAQVRLILAVDQQGTLAVDGSESTAVIAQAGAEAVFTFTATAGQAVTVDAGPSTLPGQCGLLTLRDPSNKNIASGCVVNGKGGIDSTVLSATGRYSIVVNPSGAGTGTLTLRIRDSR